MTETPSSGSQPKRKRKPMWRSQIRMELASRTLEMTLATIHGLRSDVERLEQNLEEEKAPGLQARIASLESELELLRRYLSHAGMRPPVQQPAPEFVSASPVVTVEAEPPAPAGDVAQREQGGADIRPLITAPKWYLITPDERALRLSAKVDHVAEGVEGTFRVFERSSNDAVAVIRGSVENGRLEGQWSPPPAFVHAVSEPDARLYFVADVEGVSTTSDMIPGAAFRKWNTPSED